MQLSANGDAGAFVALVAAQQWQIHRVFFRAGHHTRHLHFNAMRTTHIASTAFQSVLCKLMLNSNIRLFRTRNRAEAHHCIARVNRRWNTRM